MEFTLGIAVDLCMAYYAHVRFDNIDLAARSQWVGRGKEPNGDLSQQVTKRVMSIRFAITVGFFIFFTRP